MMRVVLTSFEPFDRHVVNSSLEVGRALAQRPPPGVELEWLVLPVVSGVCVEQAGACIEAVAPALVLALGQAAGAGALRLEQQAVNCNDFRIPDNAGRQPRKEAIVAGGPAVYRTEIGSGRLRQALQRRNIPAELSGSAGTYVCNHLLYGLLHRATQARRSYHTGFVHLPLLPGQVSHDQSTPAMSLQQMVEGISTVITTYQGTTTACQ